MSHIEVFSFTENPRNEGYVGILLKFMRKTFPSILLLSSLRGSGVSVFH